MEGFLLGNLKVEQSSGGSGSGSGGSSGDSSSSSASGGDMRTVLYSNNWGTTAVNTITLSESYRNFDRLEIQLIRISSVPDISSLTKIVECDAINKITDGTTFNVPGHIVLTYYDTEWIAYSVNSNTELGYIGSNGAVVISKIVGVKLNSFSGSSGSSSFESSSSSIKSFTYTGTGGAIKTITFPETPENIYGIICTPGSDGRGYITSGNSFVWGATNFIVHWSKSDGSDKGSGISLITYDGNSMTIYGYDDGQALNYTGAEYTVYYSTKSQGVNTSSNEAIKHFSWTGTGTLTNSITFPETPIFILGIVNTPGTDTRGYVLDSGSFVWGAADVVVRWSGIGTGSTISEITYDGNTATIIGETAAAAFNHEGAEFTVYYLTKSQGISVFTKTEWHNLTVPQKNQYGLVALRKGKQVTFTYGEDWTEALDAVFSTPLYSNFGFGRTGIDYTYTVENTGKVLVINIETGGEASGSKYTNAQISTTGSIVWSSPYSHDYIAAADTRDVTIAISVINVEVGDTITLTNNHTNNYSTQAHLIFEVNEAGDVPETILFETVVGNHKDNTLNFTPTEVGTYIIMAVLGSAAYGSGQTADISGATNDNYFSTVNQRNAFAIGQYELDEHTVMTLSTANQDSYASKAYLIWKVD